MHDLELHDVSHTLGTFIIAMHSWVMYAVVQEWTPVVFVSRCSWDERAFTFNTCTYPFAFGKYCPWYYSTPCLW